MKRSVRTVFTTSQAAKLCNVAPRTVSKWFDSGRLRGWRIPGSQDRRIPRDSLIDFLNEHKMPLPEELRGDDPARNAPLAESSGQCSHREFEATVHCENTRDGVMVDVKAHCKCCRQPIHFNDGRDDEATSVRLHGRIDSPKERPADPPEGLREPIPCTDSRQAFWIKFKDRDPACVMGDDMAKARSVASAFGTVLGISNLPLKATPCLNGMATGKMCPQPDLCNGTSICPRRPACY